MSNQQRLSAHFTKGEFRCQGHYVRGHLSHDTVVHSTLVEVLERLRAIEGRPLRIVSGHRCRWWNRKIKGAPRSAHIDGAAADLPDGRFSIEQARAAGARGVGVSPSGFVTHVDVAPWRRRFTVWRYK